MISVSYIVDLDALRDGADSVVVAVLPSFVARCDCRLLPGRRWRWRQRDDLGAPGSLLLAGEVCRSGDPNSTLCRFVANCRRHFESRSLSGARFTIVGHAELQIEGKC